ncbi:MAG: hypothetical protein QXK49_02230 [Candidatus Aenigmatarchaeota archaeon]
MSFLRSLATFLLSFIFVSFILMAITSYNIGNLIQKNSIKNFIISESLKFTDKECENQCNQYLEYKEECMQLCHEELENQIKTGVNKAVDEVYQKQFFSISLDFLALFLSQYFLFLFLGILSGILLIFASKTPFLTFGKNFISISVSLIASSFIPQFITASVNLPFNLGEAISNYFSQSFNQQMIYGIIFLVVGILLIIINYAIKKLK